ncbi:MAG: type 3-dehydroquinate dehydratase, partial [Bacteroidota bacterium]
MKIAIVNGPNLNLVGSREPQIYGTETFESYLASMRLKHPGVDLIYFQSNVEGEIINFLQQT